MISELRRLRQENHEPKVSLGYIKRCCLSKKKSIFGKLYRRVAAVY
jgi:hypothetical protein